MAQANYNQVISEIKTLDLPDQIRLLEDMAKIISKKVRQAKPRSILEIKGKGKNIWKGVNVKSYSDQERSSWNG